MSKLLEIARAMKANNSTKGELYILRIPAPEKEHAKASGAKWNNEEKHFEVRTEDIDNHPLKHLQVTNPEWIQLKGNIPFDYKKDFKDAGVVSDKIDDKWCDFVLATEKYIDVIEALTEAELL